MHEATDAVQAIPRHSLRVGAFLTTSDIIDLLTIAKTRSFF